jgi:molybdenum cofactor cytidylyltransferase
MDFGKVAAVLLAAGRGTRFGGNKLEAMLGDTMLGLHAAQTLAEIGTGHRFAVHDPSNGALAIALSSAGYSLIHNNAPEAGLSHSLALAAKAVLATDADAMLVCLADMPFVTAAHLQAIIETGGDQVVTSASGNARMPPALFPRRFLPMLGETTGDHGARALLRDAIAVAAADALLADIDTRADLARWL